MRIIDDFRAEKTPWKTFYRKAKHTVLGAAPETWVIKKYIHGLTLNVGAGDDHIPFTIGVDNYRLEEYTTRKVAVGTLRADVLHLPFYDGVVDVIVAKHIWEHVAQKEFLREMHRVLYLGGTLALVLPNWDYLGDVVYWRDPTHIWRARPKEVLNLFLTSEDWAVVQFNKLARWHYPWAFDVVVRAI